MARLMASASAILNPDMPDDHTAYALLVQDLLLAKREGPASVVPDEARRDKRLARWSRPGRVRALLYKRVPKLPRYISLQSHLLRKRRQLRPKACKRPLCKPEVWELE